MPRSGEDRYAEAGRGALLGAPIAVTKSKNNCPGEIFTISADYKTREWATFRLDDVDATPVMKSSCHNDVCFARPQHQTNWRPKRQDIVIPNDVSTQVREEMKPFSTLRCKEVSPSPTDPRSPEVTGTIPTIDLDDDESSCSASACSESTNGIFGIQHASESYNLRGTKLTKNAAISSKAHSYNNPYKPNRGVFPLDSLQSTPSNQTGTNKKKTSKKSIAGVEQSEAVTENVELPSHQIHSRMMGWKLTSPERRRNLLNMLEKTDLSTASLTEVETFRKSKSEKFLGYKNTVSKRQSEAYERSVRRLALHQNKDFKRVQEELHKRRAKENKLRSFKDVATDCVDPFHKIKATQNSRFEEKRGIRNTEVTQKVKSKSQSQIPSDNADQCIWDSFPAERCISPSFQTVNRNPRALLNPAERMELLSNARDVESSASLNHAGRMLDEFGFGDPNSFIGRSSPKRGLTGEMYIMSLQKGDNVADRNHRSKPVPVAMPKL